jgi:hypothetical protein
VTLAQELKARALELGFLACGITDPSPPPHADRLDAWLANGYAGTMRYLHRQAKRRKNPLINVPESLAVVVLLENYYWPDAEADLIAPRVAKYARGEPPSPSPARRLADWLRERGALVAHPYWTTVRSPSATGAVPGSAGSGRTRCSSGRAGSFSSERSTDLRCPPTRRSRPTTAAAPGA